MTARPYRTHAAGVRQDISGAEARVAGANYFEFGHSMSSSRFLETAPTDQLDELSVENERLFSRRFGADVPREARAGVIAIKSARGFVDSEVRWLLRSGLLKTTRKGAHLEPSIWAPATGWYMAVSLTAFCASSLLVIMFSSAPAWKQGLGAGAVLAMGLGLNVLIARLFLIPWRLAQGHTSKTSIPVTNSQELENEASCGKFADRR